METKYMIYGGLFCVVVMLCFIFVGVVSYIAGEQECKKRRCSELFEEDLIINKFDKSFNLSILMVSLGLMAGLILHGFPFRFDFRRSTVYNEYSEDDEDDWDDDG